MSKYVLGVSLVFVCLSSAQTAQVAHAPEQKGRIGNWSYISGVDGMFQVPRFVGAVHDAEARTSLIFTCQGRPGVAPGKDARPIMTMRLSDPVGKPGRKTVIKMRLDETPVFKTKWVTSATRETTLEDSNQADPLQLLFRIAGRKHQLLVMEMRRKRLTFDLDGASAVLFQMLDTCVNPAMGIESKSRKRRGK